MKLLEKIDHIGYAVKDIDVSASFYKNNGWSLSPICDEKIQNSKIAFLTKEGLPTIELVSPLDGPSPVDKFINNGGVQPYHICYEVENIMDAVIALHEQDFIPLFMPVCSEAMDGRQICYLFNKDAGLIEIVEKKAQ